MPYPFAHPAAVLPLVPLMGRLAVPSALVIGSMVPDAWYLVPGLDRTDSHSASGLVQFCAPVGLLLYLAWHLLFKQPLAAAVGRQAAGTLPPASWAAVLLSIVIGALTHVGWDAVAHSYAYNGIHVFQHASTLIGTAVVGWWMWWRLGHPVFLPLAAIALGLAAATGTLFWWHAGGDMELLRQSLREAFVAGTWLAGGALLAYCTLWKLRR